MNNGRINGNLWRKKQESTAKVIIFYAGFKLVYTKRLL